MAVTTLGSAPAADVAGLSRLCGNLPLALRIAAAKVTGTQPQPLPGLLAAMRDERGRLGTLTDREISLTSTFTVTYRQLTAPARRMFGLLGLQFGAAPSLDVCAARLRRTGTRCHCELS